MMTARRKEEVEVVLAGLWSGPCGWAIRESGSETVIGTLKLDWMSMDRLAVGKGRYTL